MLDDTALGALFDPGPPPWAVINTVGGFAGYAPLPDLDPAVLTGELELNLVSAALVTKPRVAPDDHGRRRPDRAHRQPGRPGHEGLRIRLLGQQAGRAAPGVNGGRRDQRAAASR